MRRFALSALAAAVLLMTPTAAWGQALPDQVVLGQADLNAPVAGFLSDTPSPTLEVVSDSAAPVVPWPGLITQMQVVVGGPGTLLGVGLAPQSPGPGVTAEWVAQHPWRFQTGQTTSVPAGPAQVRTLPVNLPVQAGWSVALAPVPAPGATQTPAIGYTAAPGTTITRATQHTLDNELTPFQPTVADGALLFNVTLERVPYLQAMTPQYVDPKGGTVVTLTGWNLDRATGVQLDGVAVADWRLVDGSPPPALDTITFVAPPHRAGTITSVTAPPGTSMTGLSGQLFYGGCRLPGGLRGLTYPQARRKVRAAGCTLRRVGSRKHGARVVRVRYAGRKPGTLTFPGTDLFVVFGAPR